MGTEKSGCAYISCPHCHYLGRHPVYFEETNEFLWCLWCHRLFTNPEIMGEYFSVDSSDQGQMKEKGVA